MSDDKEAKYVAGVDLAKPGAEATVIYTTKDGKIHRQVSLPPAPYLTVKMGDQKSEKECTDKLRDWLFDGVGLQKNETG